MYKIKEATILNVRKRKIKNSTQDGKIRFISFIEYAKKRWLKYVET